MKRYLLILTIVLGSISLTAQNLQTHYDFGKDRGYFTTTVEMFKPDKLGNTFFFIDMDYCVGDVDGISMAYWEIARVMTIKKSAFGIHGEFNGGFGQFSTPLMNVPYRINEAYLLGLDYSWNAEGFSKGYSLKALYKYIDDKHDASFQLTGVWYYHFLDRKMSFTGFADFWREDSDFNFDGKADASFVFLAEPQIWYHLNKNFSFGGEIELNNNFANLEGFHVNPTLGLKWTF